MNIHRIVSILLILSLGKFCLSLEILTPPPSCSQGEQKKTVKTVARDNDMLKSMSATVFLPPPVMALDPNEIVGPMGYITTTAGDTTRWVSTEQSMPYTIYFENDPERATAAALVVSVRMKIDPHMNPSSFGIGSFGFGNRIFAVDGAPVQYQKRLDLREEMNIYVDVVAGIDITTNELFWIFSSIDPATGLAPTEAERGFLPVNDSTHAGEGFVNFVIKPRSNCHTADTIAAQASIVFDINDPIRTNRWVNTVDANAPASSLALTRESDDSLYFTFSGTDDATGISNYSLYYSANGSANRLYGTFAPSDTATFPREENTTYRFFSLATDNVGNREALKATADTLMGMQTAEIAATPLPAGSGTITGTGRYQIGSTIGLTAQPNEGYSFNRWVLDGVPQGSEPQLQITATESRNYIAEMVLNSYPITLSNGTGAAIQLTHRGTHTINPTEAFHFDSIDVHLSTAPCYNNATFTMNGAPIRHDTTIVVAQALSFTASATAASAVTEDLYDQVCLGATYVRTPFAIPSDATSTAGIYTYSIDTASIHGCDSTAILHLTVNTPSSSTETLSTCDSITWHGTTYTASTTFTTTNATGCDSTVTLNLTINHASTSTETLSACERIEWHGTTYTASTSSPTFTTTNATGCDSTVTLNLTIHHASTSTETLSACDSITWHGTTYTASTSSPTFTTTNATGCDSTITLNLTIHHASASTETLSACDSITWHGTTYSASTTTPTFTTTNATGCDSTVTLNLTIHHASASTETLSACDSITWHGTTYTASTTTPTFTTTNATGCDSTVTLNLTINHASASTETLSACDSITWHGTTHTASTSSPTFTTTNATGCDSTVTLNLTIEYGDEIFQTDTLHGQYEWHGNRYQEAGQYTWTGVNQWGCDSIVTLTLVASDTIAEGVIMPTISTIKVFPNPTTGLLTIDAYNVSMVDIYDLTGRHIARFHNSNSIDISHLEDGVYNLQIKYEGGIAISRIILRR